MRESRFTESQIIVTQKQVDAGSRSRTFAEGMVFA